MKKFNPERKFGAYYTHKIVAASARYDECWDMKSSRLKMYNNEKFFGHLVDPIIRKDGNVYFLFEGKGWIKGWRVSLRHRTIARLLAQRLFNADGALKHVKLFFESGKYQYVVVDSVNDTQINI